MTQTAPSTPQTTRKSHHPIAAQMPVAHQMPILDEVQRGHVRASLFEGTDKPCWAFINESGSREITTFYAAVVTSPRILLGKFVEPLRGSLIADNRRFQFSGQTVFSLKPHEHAFAAEFQWQTANVIYDPKRNCFIHAEEFTVFDKAPNAVMLKNDGTIVFAWKVE